MAKEKREYLFVATVSGEQRGTLDFTQGFIPWHVRSEFTEDDALAYASYMVKHGRSHEEALAFLDDYFSG